MYVPCPKCGVAAWLETHWDCPECGAALRRCVDCRHYEAARSFCRDRDGPVGEQQAREPTRLSVSYTCQAYERATLRAV